MRQVVKGLMQNCSGRKYRVNGPDESVRCLPTKRETIDE